MIDMGRISEIRQRIAEIEQQFGAVKKTHGADFSKKLQAEMQKKVQPDRKASNVKMQGNAPKNSVQPDASFPVANKNIEDMVKRAAQKYNVDPRLVSAVAETESGGNQNAVSEAGAIGVMQLMPGTAAALGVNPYDASQNIEGGAKYLRQMLDSFGGDVRKAVAAYNAGPQAVRDYNGVPPYAETQDYVNKVLDIYR